MKRGKLKDEIEHVLTEFPESRNSDITLMIHLWEVFYSHKLKTGSTGKKGVWLEDLYTLPREDNIKRIRAVIQNEEYRHLPTSWEVARQRRINEDRWRAALGYPPKLGDTL